MDEGSSVPHTRNSSEVSLSDPVRSRDDERGGGVTWEFNWSFSEPEEHFSLPQWLDGKVENGLIHFSPKTECGRVDLIKRVTRSRTDPRVTNGLRLMKLP